MTGAGREPCPESGICECGSDDLHIAADSDGHYVECCECGKEYEHDGWFPGDDPLTTRGRG